jgi:hypothetical protein
MQTALRASGIALAATGWLFAPVALAHLPRPIGRLPPRLGAAMDVSGSLSGAGSDRRAATIRLGLVRDLQPPAEIASRSALLGGRLPWVPAPIFDMFDVFQFESFDPKTGDHLLYAKVAPRTAPDGAVR